MAKFLSVHEVADLLKRTPKTIYRWLTEGGMFRPGEVSKVKDGYLIKESAVSRIIRDGMKN